jgi:hypothetical protein
MIADEREMVKGHLKVRKYQLLKHRNTPFAN